MESGYHSDSWFELGRLLFRPERLRPFVAELARRLGSHRIEAVCGPMAGGAKLAEMIAAELGIPAFFSERFEPPGVAGLFPIRYEIPAAAREALRGKAIAIVDDVISAGSAVRGTHASAISCGARPVVFGALFVFGGAAAEFAAQNHLALEAIALMPFGMWPPDKCPLCQAGMSLESISDAV
jgi:orotate phosphoribosyltransferase